MRCVPLYCANRELCYCDYCLTEPFYYAPQLRPNTFNGAFLFLVCIPYVVIVTDSAAKSDAHRGNNNAHRGISYEPRPGSPSPRSAYTYIRWQKRRWAGTCIPPRPIVRPDCIIAMRDDAEQPQDEMGVGKLASETASVSEMRVGNCFTPAPREHHQLTIQDGILILWFKYLVANKYWRISGCARLVVQPGIPGAVLQLFFTVHIYNGFTVQYIFTVVLLCTVHIYSGFTVQFYSAGYMFSYSTGLQ
jgi:hypothetical protein